MCKALLLLSAVPLFFFAEKRVTGSPGQMAHIGRGGTAVIFSAENNDPRLANFTYIKHPENTGHLTPGFTRVNKAYALATPVIAAGAASGVISGCVGTPSASVQQFNVSGTNLTGNITVVAPAGFEVSLALGSGFAGSVVITPAGGLVVGKTVFVRAAAAVVAANISGQVTLTTTGATTKKVNVKGVVNALPVVYPFLDRIFTNGDVTAPLSFAGTGNTYYWTNDLPSIGLAASSSEGLPSFAATNTGSSPLVAHVSVTSQRVNVAYIPNYMANTVSVVNTITNKIIKVIPVGVNPGFVAISPDGKKAYVANVSGISVSIINTETYDVKEIPILDNPSGLVFSKDGTRAYVNSTSGQCTVIDVANDAVLTSLTFANGGTGIALSNDGQWIYAIGGIGDTRVYDTSNNTEIIYLPTPGGRNIVTSPDGKTAYVSGSFAHMVYVIDVASNVLTETIPLTTDAEGITVSPDGSRVYVTNMLANTVTVINATNNSVLTTLPVGQSPQGISVTPDGKYVYVANADSGTLTIINTADYTVAGTVPGIATPHAIGNFITPGINDCISKPVNFTITVNPSPATITPGAVGGLITGCIGAPSTSTQQFTVSGNNLSGNINAAAPAGFEISFSQISSYTNQLSLVQSGGAVTDKVIYVRTKASGTPASLAGDVVLSTAGAPAKNVAVKGVVNDLPTVNAATNPVYNNGNVTTPVSFSGSANTYTWTNDNTAIGLAASGTGNIPSFTAINTGATAVKGNITATPLSSGYLYLTGKNNVLLVNADLNKQTETLNTSGDPAGVAVSPDGTLAAITDITLNTVSFISTTTHKVVRTVNNIASPLGICFSADGKKVYVANENTFNVTIIDVATGIAEAPIHVGVFPYGIAASPDGTTVYVGCIGENAIIAMDTQTHAITPIKVNFGPTGIAVSPDNTRVYATSAQYNGLLKVVNTATKMVIANIPIGDVSTGVCVSPDGSRVYVSNTNSNSVMVIDAVANKVIKTLTVGTRPFGVSLTPDGKYLYVANEDSHNVHVISTADNTIVNVIDVGGQLGISLGNFFAPGTGCTGTPVKFTITVNGSGALTATNATGNISGCAGEVSPTTQQFAFSGGNLSGDITIKAPAGFEVALSRATGFANSLVVPPGPGSAVSGTVLIRALASATTGNIAGDVVLSSPGLPDKNVAVNAVIVALPTANPVSDKSVNNGDIIPVINLTGTAPTYTWTNDMPGIGLPAIGSGDIPSFTAINSGQTPITATITVIPSNSLCNGNTTTFKINIAPSPTITAGAVSGSITACQGTASASPNIQQFTVSGSGLKSDMEIAAPAFTEISLTSTGGYTTKLTLTRTAGTVNPTIVYVRSSASALAGNFTGTVNVSSTGTTSQIVYVSGDINALPVVDQVSPFTFNDGAATIAINFTGTGTSYSWTNDMPGIGLPANGNGDVPSFTAINNGQTVLTATITVTPSNGVCSGSPVVFKITVNPTLVPGISYTSALSPLNTVYGTPSASGSFTVAGTNLAAGVLITPPAGFEVSTDGVDFNNTVTVGGPGTFTAVKVYIRLAKTVAAGSYSGNISLTSGGVSSNIPMPNSTVSPAPVVVTADNKTRSINSENPPLTITYSGFVNNQTEANLIQKPTLATLASLTSAAGNYAITFTGNAQSPNYTFTYVPGVLTITPLGIVIVNAFSPNGDGTNDTWAIKQIEYYPNCTVDIFNRYGAKVFSSLGYDKQWNGQSGGGPVPAGTYYYLINLRDGSAVKAGWVAVIR